MGNAYEALAAVAVVRELYDTGKDMYDVLAGYVRIIIATEHLNNFSCAEITERINKNNSFKLSESVVKTALKRLDIPRDHGTYHVNNTWDVSKDMEVLEVQNKQNQLLLENLYSFIQQERQEKLSANQKNAIQNQFCRYLLNEEIDDEFSLLISRYIMEVSADEKYISIINRIKEGALVYEGICYSPDLSEVGKWTTELTICLEQEILFYIAGYNGDIHKELYQQLLDFVDEINKYNKKGKKYIRLCYTQDVKEEMEGYFTAAEIAFSKGEIINPSRNAMLYILKDVASKSDIQTKKVKLYNYLSSKGITFEKNDFYSPENQQYNRVTEEVYKYNIDNIETDRNAEYIKKCTDKINQIEILRRNHNEGIENVKYILLTANKTVLKCAYSKYAHKSGEVPKATVLDFLINRFWFELNKGFGKSKTPKTINMVSRARMVLSLLTTNKVSRAYDEIREKYNKGEVTAQDVTSILCELRLHSKTPDEIRQENLDDDINFLNDFDINEQIENIKRAEIAQAKAQEKIAFLETAVTDLQEEKEKALYDKQKKAGEYEVRIKELENQLLEKEKMTTQLTETIQEIHGKEHDRKLKYKKMRRGGFMIIGIITVAIVLFLLLRQLFKIDNSVSGVISIILTIILAVIPPLPINKLWRRMVTNCKL